VIEATQLSAGPIWGRVMIAKKNMVQKKRILF